MKKIILLLLSFCLLICVGCKKQPSELSIRLAEETAESLGDSQGFKDGSSGLVYKSGFNDKWTFHATESENEILQEHHSIGYSRGYDKGYNRGLASYRYKQKAELAQRQEIAKQLLDEYESCNVKVTTSSAQNTDSPPSVGSATFHSNESIYSDYYNYEETSDCVEGVVVYEGDDDYYIVETRRGYTVLERRYGSLYEGHKVRGELNRSGTKYLINRNRDSEVRVCIEDYALSEDDAIEWMGENDHLKYDDQRAYDANN